MRPTQEELEERNILKSMYLLKCVRGDLVFFFTVFFNGGKICDIPCGRAKCS